MDVSKHWPRWREWLGGVTASSGWLFHHQLVSNALHFDCVVTAGWRDVGLGVLALAWVLYGGWVSWRQWPGPATADAEQALRRFAVALSLMGVGIAVLAIGLQMAAGLVLPGCRP